MKDFAVVIKIILLLATAITAIQKCENPTPWEIQPITLSAPQSCVKGAVQIKGMLYAIYGNQTTKTPLSIGIKNYVNELEKVQKLPSCPMAFQVTFQKYVSSWKPLIPIAEKYPDKRGPMRELLKELEQSPDSTAVKNRMRIINANWKNVETLAATNGI